MIVGSLHSYMSLCLYLVLFMIFVNARNLGMHTTGVQRYTKNIVDAWNSDSFELIKPNEPAHGVKGHLWEQVVLPFRARNGILWSPSNTGPLSVSSQVVTIHDVVPFDHPEWLNQKFVSWYQFIQPRLVSRVAHIITISEFSKQRIVDVFKVPENKVSVIYNGVDVVGVDGFIPKCNLNVPFSRYVLSVGSLEPRKNIVRLISSWRKIKNTIPDDVGLVIVGAKGVGRVFSIADNYDSDADINDRVHFTGHVTDEVLSSLYSNAAVFCYPSIYEGFGLPPLEAMAYGIPVITSNTTAMAELCDKYARLVSPYDEDEIAGALHDAVINPDIERAILAKKSIASLTWSKCAKETLDVLQGVLS